MPEDRGLAAGVRGRHDRPARATRIGSNTFIIVRIMEPFWFFAGIVLMLPQLERDDLAPTPPPKAPPVVTPARIPPGHRVAVRFGR